MRQAFKNLKEAGGFKGKLASLTEDDIMPTDSYERYLPYSHDDADMMRADTTLLFFDYPLDYEVVEDGTYYHDPSIPIDQPSFLYAVQPAGTKIPNTVRFRMEKLADLYIPEHDPEFGLRYKTVPGPSDFAAALEDEAFRIVGLKQEEKQAFEAHTSSERWHPSGKITIQEQFAPNLYFPIQGVKIVFTKFLRIGQSQTNEQGEFSFDPRKIGFRGAVTYRIKWEHSEFDLRDGDMWQMYSKGAKLNNQPWNKQLLWVEEKESFAGNVFRAARFYWDDYDRVFARPSTKGLLEAKIKIKLFNEKKSWLGLTWMSAPAPFAKVRIANFTNAGEIGATNSGRLNAQTVISTTFHELAHVRQAKVQWNKRHLITDAHAESWAVYVEWELTRRFFNRIKSIYVANGVPSQNTNELYNSVIASYYASQNATKNNDTRIAMGYTPFFVDLQDAFSADQDAYVDNIELLYPNTREYEDFVLSKTNLHECFIPLEKRAVSMGKGEAYKNYLKSFESNTKK